MVNLTGTGSAPFRAGLDFHVLTVATAFSSKPSPKGFVIWISVGVPVESTTRDIRIMPWYFSILAATVYEGSGEKVACGAVTPLLDPRKVGGTFKLGAFSGVPSDFAKYSTQ